MQSSSRYHLHALLAAGLVLLGAAGCTAEAGGGHQEAAFTMVTLNIWHDQQDWPARRDRIVEELRALAPDVLCLQEVLQNPELPNQAETIADSLDYHVYFTSIDPPSSPKRYGNALLSPHPLTATHGRRLKPEDDYRVVAHARIALGDQAVDAYCTHLHYSGEAGGEETRGTQLQDLLAFVDSTSGQAPVILAGDFNTPPDAPELQQLRPRFQDAYAATHPDRAQEPTTLNPHLGHTPRRIDYLFYEPDALRPLATEIVFDEAGPDSMWASDHFGVYGQFAFIP